MDSIIVLTTADCEIYFFTDTATENMVLISILLNIRNKVALENFSYILCLQKLKSHSVTS